LLIVFLVLVISFVLSLLFGALAYIAKTKWLDIEKTQKFAALAILFTIIFMVLGIATMPD